MTRPNGSGTGLNLVPIATAILERIEAHFADANVELPDRRYIAPGATDNVAHDFSDVQGNVCGQLVVTLDGIGWGASSQNVTDINVKPGAQSSAAGVRHAVFQIQLVRCTPSANRNSRFGSAAPAVEDIHAAGLDFLRDAELLSQALLVLCSELTTSFITNRAGLVQAGVIQPIGPSGGVHGAQAQIEITVGV